MTRLRHTIIAPLAAAALVTVAGCGSDDSTATGSSSSTPTSGSTAESGGSPGRGPGGSGGGVGGGAGGGMQTFTAVDLDTDGDNAADANTDEVVTAANAFLATLDADTTSAVSYDFSDNQSRQTWSNFPTAMVAREGVALSELDDDAKTAAMAVVKAMLSEDGYAQVQTVQESDDWLKENSASGNEDFGSDIDYYIAIYGTPSMTEPFMVQFGGHHLARNYTYDGTTASITPDFTGTEPKSFTVGTTDVEPMKEKAGTLFSVFDSLTDEESADAELSDTIDDILMGPGVDSGEFPDTQGLAVSDLTDDQQQLVLDAIGAWVNDASSGISASLMQTYESELDDTSIAFANSDTVDGESTYLRIDGPHVWIELVNTRSMSTPNVHYHGVYRDKNDDYGSSNPSA